MSEQDSGFVLCRHGVWLQAVCGRCDARMELEDTLKAFDAAFAALERGLIAQQSNQWRELGYSETLFGIAPGRI